MLTSGTSAQLELSRRMAQRFDEPSVNEISGVIRQCLDRDSDWVKVSRSILTGIKNDDTLRLDPSIIALKEAFDLMRQQQNIDAIKKLDGVINEEQDYPMRAWLLTHKAMLQHTDDPEGAQKTLVAAHKIEPNTLKPLDGMSYKHLAPHIGLQADKVVLHLQKRCIDTTSLILYVQDIADKLAFNTVDSGEFESAIEEVAHLLGFASQRPERLYGEGPDNLWCLEGEKYVVIECKNGVQESNTISKRDAGQLGQSVEWFKAKYPTSESVPLIIHPTKKLGKGATAVTGMRILLPEDLRKLSDNLVKFSHSLRDPSVRMNPREVANRLQHFQLNSRSIINCYSSSI